MTTLPSHLPLPDDLRESEERFRATFENAALGIAHIALDGRMLHVNPRLCAMHGYSRQELLGMRAGDLIADGGAGSAADVQRLLDGQTQAYTAERRFVRKSGEVYPVRVSVSLVKPATGEPYLISFVEDLSERAAARQRIREQAMMLDEVDEAIVVHALDRTIRYWNLGAQRLFGWTAEQAVGRTFSDLLGPKAGTGADNRHALLQSGYQVAQVECRAADGRMLLVERRLSVIRDEAGAPTAVLSVNVDATERVQAQRTLEAMNNLLEERIRQRTAQLEESNQELRMFAYALAHDLRSPLASIGGFSGELERRLAASLEPTHRHYLQRIRAGVQMMSDLTDAMLSLAQLSDVPLARQPVDLSALARAWEQRMREQHPQRPVDILIEATPPALGDARLLTNLLENLLGNAWKFSSGRAPARIVFSSCTLDDGQCAYAVADNGAGFEPAYADKLFAPFQRLHTASEFEGTGIGLAIVRKIVSRHGGRAWAEGRAGEGATFSFTLQSARPE